MVIDQLRLQNYRNYQKLDISFSKKINIFFGNNGQGKSNLAEGIYFLCHLDSFRTHRFHNLVQFGNDFSQIKASLSKQGFPYETRIEIQKKGRKVWLNGGAVNKLSEYATQFYAIAFNPDHLHAFRQISQERRNFLNRYFAFIDKPYLQQLRDFRTVHSQKNRLLKNGEFSSLKDWNVLFVEKSCDIIKRRRETLDEMNEYLPHMFHRLTGRPEQLMMTYHPGLPEDKDKAAALVERSMEREKRAGHALHGAHRDDFQMAMGADRPDEFFSQGEYRISLLALKLALGEILSKRAGFYPILILDDLFSELDVSVRQNLQNYLKEIPNQVFVTATEQLNGFEGTETRIMEIEAGQVL